MQKKEDTARAAIIAAAARIQLTQAIIKDDAAFERTYKALQETLSRSWDTQIRAAITAALERLAQLGAGNFTRDDIPILMQALEREIGADALMAAMRGPALNYTEVLYGIGAKEVWDVIPKPPRGVDVSFTQADLRALELTQRANLFWVGNSWNSYTDKLFRAALQDYYEQGYSRKKLMDRMAEDFAGLGERGYVYWDMLADHTATKTREIGRIGAYDAGGIEYVQVRAHLDHRTTQICRDLHNRIIPLSRLKQQRDGYLAAVSRRDANAAKAAWEMHGEDASLAGIPTRELPIGTAMPPYHFRCRTITVAYFKPSRDDIPKTTLDATANRRKMDKRELEAALAYAEKAEWADYKTDGLGSAQAHFQKHGRKMGYTTVEEYTRAAKRLLREADEIYTITKNGYPQLAAVKRLADGKAEMALFSLKGNTLASYHKRKNFDDWARREDHESAVEHIQGKVLKMITAEEDDLDFAFDELDRFAGDILFWQDYQQGEDMFDALLPDRTLCEIRRAELTAAQQARLDEIDALWMGNSTQFNQAFKYYHRASARKRHNESHATILASHWWWWPL